LYEVFMLGLASQNGQNGHSGLSVPRGAAVPGARSPPSAGRAASAAA